MPVLAGETNIYKFEMETARGRLQDVVQGHLRN